METNYFVGKTLEEIEQDYGNWMKQYKDYYELEQKGFRFPLVYDQNVHRIILYELRTFYDDEGHVYVMEVSFVKDYKNYDEAYANVDTDIAYYIDGRIDRLR